MNTITDKIGLADPAAATALECDFPLVEISQVAEQESWRKEINRPIYHIHKWWATRLGSVFRGIALGALSKPGTDTWAQFYKTHDLRGKVVLDPFMGSASTGMACIETGRLFTGIEVTQHYYDVSVRRLQAAVPPAVVATG